MNLERPFRVGDWIMIHGRTPDPDASVIGMVIDINWRTTRLKTADDTVIVITATGCRTIRRIGESRQSIAARRLSGQGFQAIHDGQWEIAESLFTEQEAALSRAAEESLEAAVQALDQYGQGLIDIITLLESQRRAVTAESSRLLVARLRLANRVNLYLALGGSFDDEMLPDARQTARTETQ